MNGKRPWPTSDVFVCGIFSALSEDEWRTSADIKPPSLVDKKTVLFSEGESADHIYIVGGGLVKTYKGSAGNSVQIVNILGPGDVAGIEALSRNAYTCSAATLARSTVFACEKSEFLYFMSRKPSLSVALIELLNRENTALQTLLCNIGTKRALPRVASCLLLFMEKQIAGDKPEPFNLPISRQEMGAFLGLSPETVSRQLKNLTSSRVIRLDHRRLTVLDLKHLKTIAHA